MSKLTAPDLELVEAAREAIRSRYRKDWHEVGAALRTRDGRVFTGVNLDTYLGRMNVCAEAVALGRAVSEFGHNGIQTIVAVRHPGAAEPNQDIAVVSPCGVCREMISDYDANARVIVPARSGPEVVQVVELLPNKYIRGHSEDQRPGD